MKNASNLPFDVNYKVRQDALKNKLEQRGIFVSSMKYDNDKIGFHNLQLLGFR
jgi:hypothetical protein